MYFSVNTSYKDNMIYLPENLKKYRVLKDLTQEDVAEYLGITPQSVSKWERGESYPGHYISSRVSQYL